MKKLGHILSDSESLIYFAVIIVGTIICATLVNKYLLRKLIHKTNESNVDLTNFIFLKHIIILVIYLVGIGWGLLVLPITKNFAHTILAGAGATTLIIGFASQQVLSNMMSGIFIIMNKPFKINDRISIQGNEGRVVEINWHDTVIEDDTNDRIIIPNSLISNNVVKNLSKNND
ncbi:MAG: mechanosensitive ion channel family protein [Bacteroidota bacterium]|nr:mechanosensitive ion channel family protein [Bacteroidota bacterium]MDQ6890677.1 mechanosensitive ion channel family protein [Bacteroidota bacterium]